MKEFKFRVWDKSNNRMIIPEKLATIRPMLDFFGNLGIMDINNACDWKGIVPKNDYELMQYTCLKDKNGKEIYEGDVVRITSMSPGGTDLKGKVDYLEGSFWVTGINDAVRLFSEIDELEVTGNIYE